MQPRRNLSSNSNNNSNSSNSNSRGPDASSPARTAKLWEKRGKNQCFSFKNKENNYIPIIRSPEPTMESARDTQSFQTAGGYIEKYFLWGTMCLISFFFLRLLSFTFLLRAQCPHFWYEEKNLKKC